MYLFVDGLGGVIEDKVGLSSGGHVGVVVLAHPTVIEHRRLQALDLSFPTVLTSGSILSAAGFLIGRITTEPAIVGIGECLCRGTLISMFLVMFILPQILYLGDKIVERTRFNIKVPEVSHSASGTVYINGRVRGRISGVVDAHIQGVIYGDVSGMLETGSYQTEEASNDNETENQ